MFVGLLMPLLVGILYYGNYFWQAQKVDPLAARLPMDGVVGTFSCEQLVDRVKDTVLANLSAIDGSLGDLGLADVAVRVVDVLPTVGALVTVSVRVPVADQLTDLLPLPGAGSTVSEATYRLDNVVLTTTSCA